MRKAFPVQRHPRLCCSAKHAQCPSKLRGLIAARELQLGPDNPGRPAPPAGRAAARRPAAMGMAIALDQA